MENVDGLGVIMAAMRTMAFLNGLTPVYRVSWSVIVPANRCNCEMYVVKAISLLGYVLLERL